METSVKKTFFCDDNWKSEHIQNNCRKMVLRMDQISENLHYIFQHKRQTCRQSHGNSKPFYAYLKKKTSTRAAVGPLRGPDNSVVTDSKGMAGILNKFFSSVFSEEGAEPVPEVNGTYLCDERLTSVNFRVRDTRELIKKLKTTGAHGPDSISARLLQEVAWEISPALTILFGKSMAEGVVPADWTRANVTPIFKKGSKSDPGNYRPVSSTSIRCKLMEGHIKRELINHMTVNNLLISTQHGFISGKSCTTNLLEFMEVATKVVDEGLSMDVVYLDFAKAFDKVPKKRLVKKLQALGIDGPLLTWIDAWLTGREQRVVLNGECSEWSEVLSGVPQGSLLGPPLFSVYINDLDHEIRRLITLLLKLADDTKVGQIIRSQQDCMRLQECLDRLMAWAARWGMSFNTKKCKVMHIGKQNQWHHHRRPGPGDHQGGEGYWSADEKQPQTCRALQQGSHDGQQCTGTSHQSLSLQGPQHLCESVQALCSTTPGIRCSCMEPMDEGRLRSPRESPEKSCGHGHWPKIQGL
jgi:hypothetical protein